MMSRSLNDERVINMVNGLTYKNEANRDREDNKSKLLDRIRHNENEMKIRQYNIEFLKGITGGLLAGALVLKLTTSLIYASIASSGIHMKGSSYSGKFMIVLIALSLLGTYYNKKMMKKLHRKNSALSKKLRRLS